MNLLPRPLPGITWDCADPVGAALDLTALHNGEVAARAALGVIARVSDGEYRANLTIDVEPAFMDSGVGLAILTWAERAALEAFASTAGTLTLAANIENPEEGERALFASAGLALAVAEDEMHRPLTDIPERNFPAETSLRPWDEQSAPLFFHAYDAAFRDRPGFPNWDEFRWRSAFTGSDEFRADLSAVVLDGPEPAAYAVVWVEDSTGWITQMGVRPQWRGQGFGEALLARSIEAFAREGLQTAALEVATNNPNARALYERMGFTVVSTYESWRKTIR